jgi:hypothetical protein
MPLARAQQRSQVSSTGGAFTDLQAKIDASNELVTKSRKTLPRSPAKTHLSVKIHASLTSWKISPEKFTSRCANDSCSSSVTAEVPFVLLVSNHARHLQRESGSMKDNWSQFRSGTVNLSQGMFRNSIVYQRTTEFSAGSSLLKDLMLKSGDPKSRRLLGSIHTASSYFQRHTRSPGNGNAKHTNT